MLRALIRTYTVFQNFGESFGKRGETDAKRVYWKLGMELRDFYVAFVAGLQDFEIKCLTAVTPTKLLKF